jgi:valyl-tRNA synthetase
MRAWTVLMHAALNSALALYVTALRASFGAVPAGAYAGMDRFDARQQLWKDMEAQGLVIKKENYTTR